MSRKQSSSEGTFVIAQCGPPVLTSVCRWTTVLPVLYTSAACISIRCLYRSVEYWMGVTGTIYRHEVYFQVFEASLMVRPYVTMPRSVLRY